MNAKTGKVTNLEVILGEHYPFTYRNAGGLPNFHILPRVPELERHELDLGITIICRVWSPP